jgi:hypothetical protein
MCVAGVAGGGDGKTSDAMQTERGAAASSAATVAEVPTAEVIDVGAVAAAEATTAAVAAEATAGAAAEATNAETTAPRRATILSLFGMHDKTIDATMGGTVGEGAVVAGVVAVGVSPAEGLADVEGAMVMGAESEAATATAMATMPALQGERCVDETLGTATASAAAASGEGAERDSKVAVAPPTATAVGESSDGKATDKGSIAPPTERPTAPASTTETPGPEATRAAATTAGLEVKESGRLLPGEKEKEKSKGSRDMPDLLGGSRAADLLGGSGIMKTLTQKIKSLELNQSLLEGYVQVRNRAMAKLSAHRSSGLGSPLPSLPEAEAFRMRHSKCLTWHSALSHWSSGIVVLDDLRASVPPPAHNTATADTAGTHLVSTLTRTLFQQAG